VRVLVAKNGEKSVQMCSVLASWGPTFGTRKDFSDSLSTHLSEYGRVEGPGCSARLR
jgi:hypothetical protein